MVLLLILVGGDQVEPAAPTVVTVNGLDCTGRLWAERRLHLHSRVRY